MMPFHCQTGLAAWQGLAPGAHHWRWRETELSRAHPDDLDGTAMTNIPDTFPLLVGVSGKRSFDPHAEMEQAIRDRVARRLRETLTFIDDALPNTPKVLLIGGAYGTDLIAAKVALALGEAWSVAVVLPYAEQLFRTRFSS